MPPRHLKRSDRGCIIIVVVLVIFLVAASAYILSNPLGDLQTENSQLRSSLSAHAFLVYSAVHYFPPHAFATENIPDTFDYHDVWKSDVPVTVYYLTDDQYAQYYACIASFNPIACVKGNITNTVGPATRASDAFTLSEGCGSYIAVSQWGDTGGYFYPNITVTYNPSTVLTGVCATHSS